MAILTKPGIITKGFPATFTINKENLAGLYNVRIDPYFQFAANWSKISIVYENQFKNSETVSFDATQLIPIAKFDVSDKVRGEFTVKAVLIFDFDGDVLVIPKDFLQSTPELQADFAVVLQGGSSTTYEIASWLILSNVQAMAQGYAA